LAEKGFDMRRPHADLLRDGIYELQASCAGVNYRLLYFFASSAESVGRLGRETQFESRFSGVFVTLGASTI